jgi:hypothetical protein
VKAYPRQVVLFASVAYPEHALEVQLKRVEDDSVAFLKDKLLICLFEKDVADYEDRDVWKYLLGIPEMSAIRFPAGAGEGKNKNVAMGLPELSIEIVIIEPVGCAVHEKSPVALLKQGSHNNEVIRLPEIVRLGLVTAVDHPDDALVFRRRWNDKKNIHGGIIAA